MLKEGEAVFSRHRPPVGYPVLSCFIDTERHTHMHTCTHRYLNVMKLKVSGRDLGRVSVGNMQGGVNTVLTYEILKN